MNELVKQGAAILMISSDLPEILGMSDRIYVMRQGRIVAEVPREEATQERIVAYAMGHEVPRAHAGPQDAVSQDRVAAQISAFNG
jgi:ABC-type uncharacterized transport system ATPase subunit